jgi:uncharacterized membrane protein YkvA (DUF1232 family)
MTRNREAQNRPVRAARAPWKAIVAFVSALLYGVSPIDLIPDLVPLLGYVDDAIAVPLMVIWGFFQFKKWRNQARQPLTIDVAPIEPGEIAASYDEASQRS